MNDEIIENNKEEKTQQDLIKAQQDKYLRIIADYENRMKRTKQDAIHSINLAIENIVLDFVPFLQDLEKAIETAHKEQKVGIELIKKNMQNILKRYGVEGIEPEIGMDFDHTLHQAINSEAKEGMPEGKIIQILQNGFKMKEKVIIPASVIISG